MHKYFIEVIHATWLKSSLCTEHIYLPIFVASKKIKCLNGR